jgi:hypothetical protein
LAAFCRGSGWGTVLGEPTATGFGLSGTAVAALLPETGLLLQFGDVVETPDGDPDALTGVLPDISCASGNALDTCLNLIDLEETPYNAAAFPRSGEQKIVR